MPDASTPQRAVSTARRLVVKVGSSSLTGPDGAVDTARLVALVNALARTRLGGAQVILVSSGAIASGIHPLGLSARPRDLATQQAAASVGQGALLAAYSRAFGIHGLTVGQVLLTADDVTRRSHYTNARRTLKRLLDLGVVPVINENDTVATSEIRFGDNDRLAALVAHLIDADALLLLSDVDALYDGPPHRRGSTRIPLVTGPADLVGIEIGGSGSKVGTGGMATKIEAAGIATAAGVTTAITAAERATEILSGEDVGTVFLPADHPDRSRRLWLQHATSARGRLIVDAGAVTALVTRNTSLLPAGITAVEGSFHERDAVDVCGPDGVPIARGLVNYSARQLPRLLGRSTKDLAKDFGPEYEREVIHRDDLVVLPAPR